MHPRHRRLALALTVVTLAACGATEAAEPDVTPGTVGGVGSLPGAFSDPDPVTTPAPAAATEPSASALVAEPAGLVGERVDGNRVIVIGDSIVASTSRRYGGQMCLALVPQHWAVEVDAETGRFVEFGNLVLDRRLRPAEGVDWDAAVIMLGNNFNGDVERYRAELDEILTRLAPRPTVLMTVTEFRADRARVNEVIESMPSTHPHVEVLDWRTITADDPSLLGGDGLHLSEAGRERLAAETAALLGAAPTGEGGTCLSTSFSDDSSGSVDGPPAGSGTGTGGTRRPTTTAPRPTTTVRPSGSTTTTVRPGTTAVATTLPPATTVATTVTPPPPTTVATPPPPTPPAGGSSGGGSGGSGAGSDTGDGGTTP